jgi:DNA-binding NarL/FixJ family response regulator
MLVDDHAMFRDGLAHTLGKEAGLEIVAQCGSAAEALELLRERPDLILLDVDLGAERGLGFLQKVRKSGLSSPVLVVTAGISGMEAMQLIEAGVNGIIHKEHSTHALVDVIRRIHAGERHLEPCYVAAMMRSNDRSRTAGHPKLTDRDRSALRFVLQGLSNREISEQLGISEGAVKASLHLLFDKLGVRTRAQLVKTALEQFRDQL